MVTATLEPFRRAQATDGGRHDDARGVDERQGRRHAALPRPPGPPARPLHAEKRRYVFI